MSKELSQKTSLDLDLRICDTSRVLCFHLENISNNRMYIGLDYIGLPIYQIFFPIAVTITQVEYKQVNEEVVKH